MAVGLGALWWLARNWPTSRETPAPPAITQATTAEETAAPVSAVTVAPTTPLSPLEQDWGIRVSRLALVKGNSAIDLRYEIVDPDRVGVLADGTNVAYLVDMATGTEIQLTTSPQEQPRPGTTRARSFALALRLAGEFPPSASRITSGKICSALIPNPSGIVKNGSKMALVIGNDRLDNLVVE